MMRAMLRLLLVCLLATAAHASKPVKKTATGCVIKGTFFLVDGTHAYRFSLDLDLKPFEGKLITMKGLLYPGDRFTLEDGTQPQVKAATCPAASLRPIKRIEAIDLRLAAGRAVKDGDFGRGVELSNEAIAVITPADCDAYVDRATIFAQKGDLDAAKADLALIKARKKCVVDRRMNWLLLQDLAKAFVDKGDKPSAVTALLLAKAACDSTLCKPDIEKALAEARKK